MPRLPRTSRDGVIFVQFSRLPARYLNNVKNAGYIF
jgi:hypothetical protein